MNEIFKIEPPKTPDHPVSIVNGKWSLYGTPVMKLDQEERNLVFAVIIKAINLDFDKTSCLKF